MFWFLENYISETGEAVPGIMGYMPNEDILGVSYLHIAKYCALYEEKILITEERLKGCYVVPRDMTVLQAIEECYHAYQRKVLGYPLENTLYKRDSIIELEIADVFEQAIKDLSITVYKIFQ